MPASRSFAALPVRLRFLTVLTGVFVTAVTANDAGAVSKSWTGGTNSDWSVATNWSPSGAPASGDSVDFPLAGANRSINLSGNRTVADVTFSGSGAYRLLDNQLTISSGDIASSLANHRIDSSVVLGGEGAWSIPSGKLSVYGSVNSTMGNTFGIDKTGAGLLEFLNTGTTNILKNYLHQAGTAEFFEGTYTLTSTSFDAFSAMYLAEGTVTVSHRAKVKGTGGGNLVLQSAGSGSSNMIIRDEQTEVATFGQLFLGASGTSGNSLTVTSGAKVRDIGLFVAGFNGSATVTVSNGATVNSSGVTVGMLTGVTGTLTVEDPSSALTTDYLALGGYNSSQKGGTGTATISDRASLAVSGELRLFSSASSLTIDAASASVGALTNDAGVVGSIKLRNDGGTPALTLTSPVSISAPGPFTFDGVISNATNGSGGIVKQGPGEQVFTKQQTYTAGTRIEGGTLTLGTDNTLVPTGAITAVGGTLNLDGHLQRTGPFRLAGGTVTGAAGSLLIPTMLTLESGTIDVPVVGAVNKTTAGTATLNQGATTTVLSLNGGTLQLKGVVTGAVQGGPSAALTLVGPTTVTDITTLAGSLNVGAHTLTTPKTVGAQSASLAGGSIIANLGFTLSGALTGYGTILSHITGHTGSSITASGGPLTLGNASVATAFSNFQGALATGAQQVNLLSGGVATLGAATTLAGGSLASLHGIQLDSGKTVTGYGTINGAFTNQGTVNGTGSVTPLVFTGSVSGAGSYAGNIRFDGAFSPGNSPAAVSFAGDVTFANTSLLLIELGGDDQGTEYDHLDVTGKLTLGGSMAVKFINGFTPTSPLSFDLFDWGTIDGGFNAINLPTVNGFAWNASQLSTTGTLSLTPIYAADFDSNGRVDAADLAILRTGFGSTAAGRATGDATGDGAVSGTDFLVWQRQLGSGVAATGSTSAVPEPSAALLAAMGLVAIRRRRSGR